VPSLALRIAVVTGIGPPWSFEWRVVEHAIWPPSSHATGLGRLLHAAVVEWIRRDLV